MLLRQEIVKGTKRPTLSWKGVLAVIGGSLVVGLLFLYFGRFDLARPVLVSLSMIVVAVAIKWELRRRVWFWITMAVIAALHVPLILFVPWTTEWVPAVVLTPVGLADLFVMLLILSVVEKRL
jgi:hypothetical protein